MSFDWDAWARDHAHPAAARRVLDWLEKHDCDEGWALTDELVELVAETVEDCAKYVERFEGVDFEMREQFK